MTSIVASAPPQAPSARHITAKAQSGGESGANTTFLIPRLATVNSDNKPKKVSVAVLKLESRFTHYSVPGIAEAAFLKANTVNTSDFPFLPSSNVSIFFDNNFVATSTMKAVSPGEDFESFLGVDPAIKVEQKPTKKVRDKRGFFTKEDVDNYHHITVIKNTKKVPLKIVLKQQLPYSSDTKIKVKLIEPVQEDVDRGNDVYARLKEAEEKGDYATKAKEEEKTKELVRLDGSVNAVEWTKTVEAGKELTINFQYNVSWPRERQIVIE